MATTSTKLHHRYRENSQKVESLYQNGITRGVYLGFDCMHELFSLKQKGTTYIYGSPFAGKSEIWFEIMINLSEFYNWHHAIYSPESGTVEEIYAELLSKYLQKPFYQNVPGHMSETEMIKATAFIDEHFFVVDPGDIELTIEGFFEAVSAMESEYGVKINTTCCDPFNELKHTFEDGRQDLYIENRLGFIRKDAMSKNRHNVIITHCRDQQPMIRDGKRYFPPASPREIAGGQAWYRKAMNLICIWRPPVGLVDEEGRPYEENEVHFIVQKYKPKGVGRRGTARLYFDQFRNRYYEKAGTQNRFAAKQIQQANQKEVDYEF